MRRLRQPTLVLAGTRDPLVQVANARLLHRLIRHSRLDVVDDGHLFLLTTREVVVDTIVPFVRKTIVVTDFLRPIARAVLALVAPLLDRKRFRQSHFRCRHAWSELCALTEIGASVRVASRPSD